MLLEVDQLEITFGGRDAAGRPQVARALNGVSFAVQAGEVLGLVGESGSGKSLTVNAIMRLLPQGARVAGGRIRFEGQDMALLDEAGLRRLRGDAITVITQSPLAALDPLARVGEQLVRVRRAHRRDSRAEAAAAALAMMERVGIPDPARRMRAWPHELSGGMAQRIVIAMALLNEPRLVIADEPTTGLDATVQVQVLEEFRAAVGNRGLGAILVTHDLGVVARYCDRAAVMFAGAIVEQAPVRTLFARPAHPCTAALIAAARAEGGAAGAPPDLFNLAPGCAYQERCARATTVCGTRPAMREIATGQFAACHNAL
jgi:oligopeptide/dipeptide ABC transporter ATP-binding protein